jgi:hypothetical protein
MKKILTRTAEIMMGDDGIIYKRLFDDIDIEVEDGKENLRAALELTGGQNYLILTDGRDVNVRISSQARQYAAGKEVSSYRIAEALLINSIANRLTANFYLKVNKPHSPTRVFTDEEKALKWLRTFLDTTNNPQPVMSDKQDI